MTRRGFTLIELLVVIVIIAILAAFSVGRFAAAKEKAYLSRMKSDLRRLATSQEVYSHAKDTYYAGAVPSAELVYAPSPGVVVTLSGVSTMGWAATATSPAFTSKTCAIFVGDAAAPPPATGEGVIACD